MYAIPVLNLVPSHPILLSFLNLSLVMLQWQNINTIILAARKSDGIFKCVLKESNGEVLQGKGLIFSLVV